MKKGLFFLALCLFTLSACNNEYTCSCAVVGTIKAKDYKMYNNKRQSQELCNNLTGDSITIDGLSGVADCELMGF